MELEKPMWAYIIDGEVASTPEGNCIGETHREVKLGVDAFGLSGGEYRKVVIMTASAYDAVYCELESLEDDIEHAEATARDGARSA